MTKEDYVDKFIKYRPNRILNELVQGQNFVISYLFDHDMTITELSKAINVSTARMAVIINSLEKEGKVIRLKSDNDKRITICHLTEKGMQSIECIKNFLREKVDMAIKTLGEEEFERFVRDLYKLIELGGNNKC